MPPVPIARDEVPAFLAALRLAFHEELRPGDVERWGPLVEPGRSLAIRDGSGIVATAGAFSRRLTVPGGDSPVAAVTMVGVRPTHRRRGLLTALMRRQLDDVRARGEAIAALWASEGAIYGRFGYGLAVVAAELEVDANAVHVASPPDLRPDLREPADAREALAAIHAAVRPERPGMLDRDGGGWWDVRLADDEHERDGAGPLRAAVVDGRGYVLYRVKPGYGSARPTGEVRIEELVAADPRAHAALWDFVLGLDLVSRAVWWLAPADEPLVHMVDEPQGVRTRLHEALWVRLVDVPRALRERTYGEPFGVVLEVQDAFCPWNAGRWALRWDGAAATCAATAAPADLALTAADLGAAHLGGTSLLDLARAGRVRELRPGTLAPASRAFRGDRAPWCPEIF